MATRGRIPADVIRKYDAAHGGPESDSPPKGGSGRGTASDSLAGLRDAVERNPGAIVVVSPDAPEPGGQAPEPERGPVAKGRRRGGQAAIQALMDEESPGPVAAAPRRGRGRKGTTK